MKKKPFTERELSLLRGNYHKIARRYKVSRQYVHMIATGIKPVKSEKSRAIFRDLEKLLETLKEISAR